MVVRKSQWWWVGLFLIPGIALYSLLVVVPVVQSLVLSTHRWVTLSRTVFVGFDNYIGVSQDKLFWNSVRVSLTYAGLITATNVFMGFVLGYLLFMKLRLYRGFKIIFFMPTVLTTVAVGFIWSYIYSPECGLFKVAVALLNNRDLMPPLADPKLAMAFVIIASSWHNVGIPMILFNACFVGMPPELLEAAEIDGATGWRKIATMIIPLSWEVLKTNVILQLVAALRSFDLVFAMTRGGPIHSTELLPLYMYSTAFDMMNLGHGAVVAVVILALCMGLTVVLRRLMQREVLQY
jgi:raffinose/stachyose/melibiose transport system permease protein